MSCSNNDFIEVLFLPRNVYAKVSLFFSNTTHVRGFGLSNRGIVSTAKENEQLWKRDLKLPHLFWVFDPLGQYIQSWPVGIIVFAHVIRPYFLNLAKLNNRKQCSLLARLWVWPSGSLMTPVLCFLLPEKLERWQRKVSHFGTFHIRHSIFFWVKYNHLF